MNEQMMDRMMNGAIMQIRMIATALIALITLIIQAVLQATILRELRRFRAESSQISPKAETKT